MIEFNIQDGRLIVDPKVLTIRIFEEIWISDPSKAKTKAVALLKYIFFLNDITIKNPYRDAATADIERLAKRDAFRNENYQLTAEEQAFFDEGSEFYAEANKDCVYRMSYVLQKKIDQLIDHIDREAVSGKNFTQQIEMTKNVTALLKAKAEAEAEVEKQIKNKKVRAGMKTSAAEKGLLKLGPR